MYTNIRSNKVPTLLVVADAGGGYAADAASEADLAALFADLRTAERAMASAVRRAGALAGSGVAERVEGGALDWAISMACRWTGTDARVLVGAAETLRHLPTVDRLFAQGLVSWGQVRRITAAARHLPVADRAVLDRRVAAAVDAYEGVDAFDPDHLCDAVDVAVEDLRDPRRRERQERVAAQANFLSIQGRLDGGTTGYWSGDAVRSATIIDALTAARPVPVSTPDGDREPGTPSRQGRRLFDALHDIAAEYLAGTNSDLVAITATEADRAGDSATAAGGDPGDADDADTAGADAAEARGDAGGGATRHPLLPGRRRRRKARPLVKVAVDVSQFHLDPTGIIEVNVPGALPRVSAALVEILARDADFQAVLFDGKRPLAASRKLRAKDVPADVRAAVAARDMGDRWPGSRAPIGWTEPHHTVHRATGGLHHVDNLVSLTRRHHTTVHDHGWTIRVVKHTGEARFKRRGRTWRSLPRDTGLPPAAGDPPHDPTPPGMPF